ncbi:MAG: hypothetical protein M0D55_04660 [Elusimicrobiota bacterium]|nr:MAG: hypothetical protein M0D55_04660 [Elusimicrobiota bacterium]
MTQTDQTPDSILTEEVIASLRRDKLLPEKQLESLKAKIASGKMKAEDWQVMIELAVDAEAKKDA